MTKDDLDRIYRLFLEGAKESFEKPGERAPLILDEDARRELEISDEAYEAAWDKWMKKQTSSCQDS